MGTSAANSPKDAGSFDSCASRRPSRAEVRACRDGLAGLVGRVHPDEVPASEASVLWAGFDEIERLAASAKTLLAARVEASSDWKRSGHRSAAEHLAQQSGTTVADAKATLEVSRVVSGLPGTREALQAGELSAKQAAAVAGAAVADPDAEERLLGLAAKSSVAELREECLRTKAAADPDRDATHRRIHKARRLRQYTDAEGAWNLSARGTPELGARFNLALEPRIDQIFAERRTSGERESRDAYAFDALIGLAEQAVAGRTVELPANSARESASSVSKASNANGAVHDDTGVAPGSSVKRGSGQRSEEFGRDRRRGAAGASGTERSCPEPRTPAKPPAPRSPQASPKHLAILRLDLEALLRGRVEGEELCEIAGLGPIPVRVARELLGESVLKLVLTKGADVANVTHLGRGPTAAQRVALLWAQPNCTAAGCVSSRVEIDHRDEYSATRQSRLDGLDPLCKHHHQLETNHDWALVAGTGKREMVPPGDARHPKPKRGPDRARRPSRARIGPPPRAPAA